MPKGGKRAGAGRKPGTRTQLKRELLAVGATALDGLTPLEHMLTALRDPAVPLARKDDMAKAAAPYLHSRPAPSSLQPRSAFGTFIEGQPAVPEIVNIVIEPVAHGNFILSEGTTVTAANGRTVDASGMLVGEELAHLLGGLAVRQRADEPLMLEHAPAEPIEQCESEPDLVNVVRFGPRDPAA